MAYHRRRYHGRPHFRHKSHFKPNFSNKKSHDSNTSQPQKKEFTGKPSFLSRIKLRYKLLIVVLIINLIILLFYTGIFLTILGLDVIFLIFWIAGRSNSCPNCHSYWAKKLVDRTHFGTHTEFEDVSRNMTHRDSTGKITGSSSVRDTHPVTVHTIQNHWTCKYCGHSWSGRVHDVRN